MCAQSLVVTDLWAIAQSQLAVEHQSYLSYSAVGEKPQSPLQALLTLVQAQQKKAIEKRWKVRDILEKIAHWINKFKEIGDTIVTYDPTHAALPWAGVRFLLQLVISDIELFGSLVDGVEVVSRLITRCGYYEAIYLAPMAEPTAESRTLLKEAVIKLYVEILTYLAKATEYFRKGAHKRIIGSLVATSSKFETQLEAIRQKENELHAVFRVVEGEEVFRIGHMMGSLNTSTTEHTASLRAMRIAMESLEQPMTRAIGHLARFEEIIEEQEWSKLSQWLGNANFREQHELIFRDLLPGTGEWMFKRPEYQQWHYSSSSSVLWLRGIPGCGKSKLCSLAVEKSLIGNERTGTNAAPIAYFYCSKTNSRSPLTPTTILGSILKQLACSKTGGGVHRAVFEEHEQRKEGAKKDGMDISALTLEECGDLILSVASDYPIQIYLDGIDELDDSRELLEVLNRIVEDSTNIVKVFISSRDVADVAVWLKDTITIPITGSDNSPDIAKFVTRSVEAAIETKRLLKGRVSLELKEHLISSLSDGAGPMFLWASLHLTQLCDQKRYKLEQDVFTALKTLPVDLKRTFDQMYQNINNYPERAKQVTKRIFAWLLVAQRPLTKKELIDAVSEHIDENEHIMALIEPKLTDDAILDLCSSFLEHNSSSQYYAFAHASVLEYFQSLPEYCYSDINYMAAHRCLAQLVQHGDEPDPFDEYDALDRLSCDEGVSNLRANAVNDVDDHETSFRQYSACYWARHYGLVTDHTKVAQLNEIFIEFVFGMESTSFELWLDQVKDLVEGNSLSSVTLIKELAAAHSATKSPVFVASVYGILPIFEYLAASGERVDWNTTNTHGVSAIYLAARFGQLEAMKYLLQTDSNVNSQGGIFGNPAQAAAFNGHTAVLELLVNHGADVCASGRFSDTFQAALIGNQNVALKLLLERNWAKEIPNIDELLSRAAYYGHHEVVDTLLKRKEESMKSDVSTDQSESPFPHDTLQAALYSGRPGSIVAMRLLKRIGDVNSEGGRFGNALQAACAGGYLPSVRWLLGHGADVNSSGRYGSALKAASLGGHDEVVSLLLQAGARSGPSRNGMFDAFEAAASRNRLSTLALLINHSPDAIDIVDEDAMRLKGSIVNPLETALKSACLRGHADIVRYLLANGARKAAVLALEAAFISGQDEVIRMLLGTLEEVPDYTRHGVIRCSAGDVLKLMPSTEHNTAPPTGPGVNAYDKEADFVETKVQRAFKDSLEAGNEGVPDIDGDYPQGRKFTWRLAASRGNRAAFENLLSKGMPLDGDSRPPLVEIAALHGNIEIVELLLDRNVAVGFALQCAIKSGRKDIVYVNF
ncbi:hypothetical protein F5B22DRAFT_248616 [Xylaria bambusicola]|uniref:uncharacterized protein n=1 Tax=Xylaria bambusicola TaxID=326684 RepID=UPI002008BBF7|nr:uncharacterized protein F5B22DRAFT_248616 [Xylaria bambusicola]KAI0513325.1 hypothetical protein F5B22DRAFT_248616 [Xylaria bambusicola]